MLLPPPIIVYPSLADTKVVLSGKRYILSNDDFKLGPAEKVKFFEFIRNGGKKVAYFRRFAANKSLSALILHTDIQLSFIGAPQNRQFSENPPDLGSFCIWKN